MARLFDDGSSQYCEVDSAAVTAYPLSMVAWAKPDAVNVDQAVMFTGFTGDGNNYHFLSITGTEAGDPVRAGTRDGAASPNYAQTTSGVTINTWHHLAGVFAAANDRRAFIDGGSKGTDANSRTPTGINRTSIGRLGDATPAWYMSGAIALPAIWNCALSDAEVQWLARGNWPHLLRPSNFCGYWLPPGVRNDRDYSGRGYHMTAYNGPTWTADPPQLIGLR